jgi:hypothetical protein
LRFVTGGSRPATVKLGLVNGFAAGGTFASLALRALENQAAAAGGSLGA